MSRRIRDPARLHLQAGMLFERRFETLEQPVSDRPAPGKLRPARPELVGEYGTDWPVRLRATEALEPVGAQQCWHAYKTASDPAAVQGHPEGESSRVDANASDLKARHWK